MRHDRYDRYEGQVQDIEGRYTMVRSHSCVVPIRGVMSDGDCFKVAASESLHPQRREFEKKEHLLRYPDNQKKSKKSMNIPFIT